MTGWTSPTHLALLLLLALLLFGAKRLPEIGRSLGRGMREFKDSVSADNRTGDEPARPHQLTAAEAADLDDGRLPTREREPVS